MAEAGEKKNGNSKGKAAAPPARPDDNLYLWRKVEQTDPDSTTPVNLGRKFTAIDSYYQVKRATEMFGPLGVGWGWELDDREIVVGADVIARAKLTLWYVDPDTSERVVCGPVIAMNKLGGAGRLDEDAWKKAITDAITKSLSYLGFSADVFLGKFDDNKYVAEMRRQFAVEPRPSEVLRGEQGQDKEKDPAPQGQGPQISETIRKAIAAAKAARTQDEFRKAKLGVEVEVKAMTDKAAQRVVAIAFRNEELRLWPEMSADD